jgi:ureidoglycolate dehydrogenase (NAD+)
MDRMIGEEREVKVAEGHDRIYLPGEIELEKEKERRRYGIPLSKEVLDELASVSGRYSVSVSL